MIAPLSLSNVLTVVLAVTCMTTLLAQSSGGVLRMWRLAVPASCAAVDAMVLLAGVFDATFLHDAEWLVAGIAGSVVGRMRGAAMMVEADHTRGLVRLPRSVDGLIVAGVLVIAAFLDFAGAALADPVLEPQHVAAISAFCAGYLGCRALAMILRAQQAPHVQLRDA
ncbi:MAG TPA: hypothetical protein VMI56_00125 [Reyranella sp.]|nr:hypothetical protein [Reyranella sp.]